MSENTRSLWIQQALPDEVWKPVPIAKYTDYYQVSNLGRVRTTIERMRYPAGYILTNHHIPQGYLYVKLSLNSQYQRFYVHRLVLSAFMPVDGYEDLDVNHINGVRSDNSLANLEWMTHLENIRYSINVLKTFKGFRPSDIPKKPKILKGPKRGEDQKAAKLNADKVREIRRLCDTGLEQYKIAAMFGVSNSVIGQIKKRKAWAHID